MQTLHKHFIESLPSRRAQLESTWLRLLGADSAALGALKWQAHKLAGSAATFGAAGVSETARDLEEELEAVRARGGQRTPRLAALYEAVRSALKRAATQTESYAPRPTLSLRRLEAPLVYAVCFTGDEAAFLTEQITPYGYRVRALDSRDEFREAIARCCPGAVLVNLPVEQEQGTRVSWIRDTLAEFGQSVPLLFASERGDFDARLLAARAGGCGLYVKPVDVPAIVEKLDEVSGVQPADPFTVLVVEDEPDVAVAHSLVIEQAGMRPIVELDATRVLDALSAHHPDVILTDVRMPGCSGLELTTVVRQCPDFMGIPIVFLSADCALDRRIAAFGCGADDYLTKPVQPRELISSISSRAARARTLRGLIARDGLTGLLNHVALHTQLRIEVSRARRLALPLAFAMLDLDHFKAINDAHGHPVGDRVLKNLARLLQQRLRKTDVIGRYGGEEFAIIFTNATSTRAAEVIDDLRDAFAETTMSFGEQAIRATFSAGVAGLRSMDDASSLCAEADRALYVAKNEGRNRVVRADPGALGLGQTPWPGRGTDNA